MLSCPKCGKAVEPLPDDAEAGEAVICVDCLAVSIVTHDKAIRRVTETEYGYNENILAARYVAGLMLRERAKLN